MPRIANLPPLLWLTAALLLGSGCAEQPAVQPVIPPPPAPQDPYTLTDVDELLSFGDKMASLPVAARTEQCKLLLKYQGQALSSGVQLHLLIGRLMSDSCGEIPKLLESATTIAKASSDERLRKLIAIETATLQRMQTTSKKLVAQEGKQKKLQSQLDSKAATTAKKDESQLLRDKLEAIRSMEKRIDETIDGN